MKKSALFVFSASMMALASCGPTQAVSSASSSEGGVSSISSKEGESSASDSESSEIIESSKEESTIDTSFDSRLSGSWYGGLVGSTNIKSYIVTISADAITVTDFSKSVSASLPYSESDTGVAFFTDTEEQLSALFNGDFDKDGKTVTTVKLSGTITLKNAKTSLTASFGNGTLFESYKEVTSFDIENKDNLVVESFDEISLTTTYLPKDAYADFSYKIVEEDGVAVANNSTKYLIYKIVTDEYGEQYFEPGVFKAVLAEDGLDHTAKVRVTENRTNASKEVSITIKPGDFTRVSSIVVSYESTKLNVGATSAKPSVTVLPEDAKQKAVKFSSSDTSVVTVDAYTGVVTAVAQGEASIICSSRDGSGVKASVPFTVSAEAIDVSAAYGRYRGESESGNAFVVSLSSEGSFLLFDEDSTGWEVNSYEITWVEVLKEAGEDTFRGSYKGKVTIEEQDYEVSLDLSDKDYLTITVGNYDYPFPDSDSIADVVLTIVEAEE